MSAENEVEVKFKVLDIRKLATRLQELGLKLVTPRTHEMNILFDLPGSPLRERGELLRIRQYGDIWVLTHKARNKNGKDGPHKSRRETETRVQSGEKMEGILRSLQFEPTFRYEKFRAEWADDKGHVVIDETPIGNFAEIEGPPEWIDSTAKNLGLKPEDYITETYAGLFLAWKKHSKSRAREMTFEAVGAAPSRCPSRVV